MPHNELLDVTAYGLRSDFLSPETMPKATVELALTKNRKLLLASVLAKVIFYINLYIIQSQDFYLIQEFYHFTIVIELIELLYDLYVIIPFEIGLYIYIKLRSGASSVQFS